MTVKFLFYLLLLLSISIKGIISYQRLNKAFKTLVILITATFVSESISRIFVYTIRNSNPGYHVFTIIEFCAMAWIYYLLSASNRWKRFILVLMIAFPVFSVLNTIFIQTLYTFPSNAILLIYLFRILWSINQFSQMLAMPSSQHIYKQSVFWMNSAVLAFSVAMPVNFGVHNYFLRHHIPTHSLGQVIYVLSMAYYLVLGYSIVLESRTNVYEERG